MTGTDANDRDASNVPPVSGAQLARYAEALDEASHWSLVKGHSEALARAVVAVADAEQAGLRAEVERLTRWKSEATEVILGLQDLGRALELPLGERITGEAAAEAARTLKAEVERLQGEVERLHAWDGLMSLLDEHWPDDIPTSSDQADRDGGPRIVSLLRRISAVREIHEPVDALNYRGSTARQVQVCSGCGTDDGNWQRWPCPTARALGVAQ